VSSLEKPHLSGARLKRERGKRRERLNRRKDIRVEAIRSGKAVTVTPAEFSELSGLSLATVYRRVYDGTLKYKKMVPEGGKRGQILIFADQLG
jgi:hypothetical protein